MAETLGRGSYAAALVAYRDVARRISTAISKSPAMAGAGQSGDSHAAGVTAPSVDVQVDHHMLAAAIQTQVGWKGTHHRWWLGGAL